MFILIVIILNMVGICLIVIGYRRLRGLWDINIPPIINKRTPTTADTKDSGKSTLSRLAGWILRQ
jgi:hypothetical protein